MLEMKLPYIFRKRWALYGGVNLFCEAGDRIFDATWRFWKVLSWVFDEPRGLQIYKWRVPGASTTEQT